MEYTVSQYFIGGWFVYCSFLETFVFLSGFLYGESSKRKTETFSGLVISKFKRLIIPCVVWGIVYEIVVCEKSWLSLADLWTVVNGLGHLWFLPMLFWCFLFEFILKECHIGQNKLMIILAVVAILPYPALPFKLNTAFYYLLFFHLGFMANKNEIIPKIQSFSSRLNIALLCVYVLLFVGGTIVRDWIDVPSIQSQLVKRPCISLCHLSRLVYSLFGVVAYIIVGLKISEWIRNKSRTKAMFSKIALNSFGIYLLQEIFMKVLYYQTNIGVSLGNATPFVCFIIVLALSFLCSSLLKKLRFSKYLV